MKSKYWAVVWDFDGVIFDSDRAVLKAVNAILAHHDLPQEPYERFRHRASNHFRWYAERGIPWSEEEIQAFFYKHFDNSQCELVDGVREVLQYLQTGGLHCGIVSAHRTDDLMSLLHRFGISDHFPHVFGGVWHKKEALGKMCETLGVLRTEALFLGDMLSDVMDGKAAGVTTVLYAPADSPHIAEAHHHITRLEHLKLLLEV